MNHQKILIAILGLSTLLIPGAAVSQSLGEIAREVRKERQEQPHKAVKVYTNDSIAKSSHPEAAPSPAVEPGPAAAEPRATEASPSSQPQEQPTGKAIKTREYWEAKFRDARATLARAKEEQQLVEDELSLLEIQRVRELDPNLSEKLSGQISAKKDELEIKREAARKAQKTLDELNKEFEASGAPEDWRGQDNPP
ncbi:MAG TPA: hypothetical protein VMV34_03465 [Terriglobia bacterium]|nr:hypothetical protein [Terriglobia bacterium]